MDLSVQELEAAITLAERRPARGNALAPEVSVLATIYALMIFRRAATLNTDHLASDVQQLLHGWRHNQDRPDA